MDINVLYKLLLRDEHHFTAERSLADDWFASSPHIQGVTYRKMVWQTYDYHLKARRMGQFFEEIKEGLTALTNKTRRQWSDRELKILAELLRYARDRHVRTSQAPLWFQHDVRHNKIPPRYTEYQQLVEGVDIKLGEQNYEA